MMPVYYGGLKLSWQAVPDWLKVYLESGAQSIFQYDLSYSQEAFLWTWGAGVSIETVFRQQNEGAITKDAKKVPADKTLGKLLKSKKDDVISFTNIFFYPDSAVLKPESYKVLDDIALILLERKELVVEIRGHTNDTNDPASEVPLSLSRAEAVKWYLYAKGITANRMSTVGFGAKYVKTKTMSEENRRVEFKIISDKK
jgi:outer membrane protein OmpA-like peptidoglycan-associated protein